MIKKWNKFNESKETIIDKINDCLVPISDDFVTKVRIVDNYFCEVKIQLTRISNLIKSIEDIDKTILMESEKNDLLLRCKEFISRLSPESFQILINENEISISLNFDNENQSGKFLFLENWTLTIYENRLRSILQSKFNVHLEWVDAEYDDYDEEFRMVIGYSSGNESKKEKIIDFFESIEETPIQLIDFSLNLLNFKLSGIGEVKII